MGFKSHQIPISISLISKGLYSRYSFNINGVINKLKGSLVLKFSDFFLSSSYEFFFI